MSQKTSKARVVCGLRLGGPRATRRGRAEVRGGGRGRRVEGGGRGCGHGGAGCGAKVEAAGGVSGPWRRL